LSGGNGSGDRQFEQQDESGIPSGDSMSSKTLAVGITLVAAAAVTTPALIATAQSSGAARASAKAAHLPAKRIEKIVQIDGQVSSGVLAIEVNRPDIHAHGPHGVRFVTGFQIQGDLTFQQRGRHRAVLNADLALKPGEIQSVIDSIESHHLVFQAEHQHLYNISPKVWFIHFRGMGRPARLAREVHAVIKSTATPLPQHSPAHPKTSLPKSRLAKILGGTATVGENGVVTVDVPRKHGVVLGGVHVSPDLNVATNIQFEPLSHGRAAAVPDFAMTASEIQSVIRVMRARHWEVGCLYNQETAEHPQLFFSHVFKTGDPIALAHQIRAGIDHTDS
jgi:hypothetical protein